MCAFALCCLANCTRGTADLCYCQAAIICSLYLQSWSKCVDKEREAGGDFTEECREKVCSAMAVDTSDPAGCWAVTNSAV